MRYCEYCGITVETIQVEDYNTKEWAERCILCNHIIEDYKPLVSDIEKKNKKKRR